MVLVALEHAALLGGLVTTVLHSKLLRCLDHRSQKAASAALLVGVKGELLLGGHGC